MLVRIIQFVRLLIILASRLEVLFSRTWRCGDRVPKGRYAYRMVTGQRFPQVSDRIDRRPASSTRRGEHNSQGAR